LAIGQLEHRLEIGGRLFDVHVVVLRMSLPGSAGVRSAGLAVNDDPFRHTLPPMGLE
jgi:hypothetical protein